MSEFYDSMDRAFSDELDLCVAKSQGEFYDSLFVGFPDGSYKLQLKMRKRPAKPITTVRLLNTYDVQTGVSSFGTEAYAKIIVRDMVIALYQEFIKREIANNNADFTSVLQYCLSDIAATEAAFKTIKEKADSGIERVIFNPPATIVFFKDGKKVVVKCQEDDDWDEEKALAMAIVKHDYGLSVFNKTLKKADRRYPESNISIDMPSLADGIASAAEIIMRMLGGKKDIERTCKNCRFNELVWSPKHEKFMPFCASDNPMINHNKSIYEEYEGFCCADFKPKEENV